MAKRKNYLRGILYWLSVGSIAMLVTMIMSLQYAYVIDFNIIHRNLLFDIVIYPCCIVCLCISVYEIFNLWYKDIHIKSVSLFCKIPFKNSFVVNFTPFEAFLLVIVFFLPCLVLNFLSLNYELAYAYAMYVIYSSGYIFARICGTICKKYFT